MSRNVHLIEVTTEQLTRLHKARLVAAAVLIVFFTAFVVFAPEPEHAREQPAVATAGQEAESP